MIFQVRRYIRLEVGVAAQVKFDPSFGRNNELTVTEGDTVEVGATVTLYGSLTAALLHLRPGKKSLSSCVALVLVPTISHLYCLQGENWPG